MSRQPGPGLRFLAIVVTVIVVVCGFGATAGILLSGISIVPAVKESQEAAEAGARLFGDLSQEWSEGAVRRTSSDGSADALGTKVKEWKTALGPRMGAPRFGVAGGVKKEARDRREATGIVRAVFSSGERQFSMTIEGSSGDAWKIRSLDLRSQ